MKTRRLLVALLGGASIFISASAAYANLHQQEGSNVSASGVKQSPPVITAWEFPWQSPQYPFCFLIQKDYYAFYETVYGKNRNDAERKILHPSEFRHEGACRCEGKDITDCAE